MLQSFLALIILHMSSAYGQSAQKIVPVAAAGTTALVLSAGSNSAAAQKLKKACQGIGGAPACVMSVMAGTQAAVQLFKADRNLETLSALGCQNTDCSGGGAEPNGAFDETSEPQASQYHSSGLDIPSAKETITELQKNNQELLADLKSDGYSYDEKTKKILSPVGSVPASSLSGDLGGMASQGFKEPDIEQTKEALKVAQEEGRKYAAHLRQKLSVASVSAYRRLPTAEGAESLSGEDILKEYMAKLQRQPQAINGLAQDLAVPEERVRAGKQEDIFQVMSRRYQLLDVQGKFQPR